MLASDAKLIKKLAWAIVLKIVGLSALWLAFFSDQREVPDANQISTQILQPKQTSDKGTHR